MGKGRNKNKEDKCRASSGKRHHEQPDEEDSDDSMATHLTLDEDLQSVQGDVEDIDMVVDSFAEFMQRATHKNVGIRTAALRNLQVALTSRYMYETVEKNKATLLDIVVKALKKSDEEAYYGAVLLALLSLQLGEELHEMIEEPLSLLRTYVMNPSKAEALRGICAVSIGLTSHLSEIEASSITQSLKALQHSWTNIKLSSVTGRLFCCSVQAWALLLQSCSTSEFSTATTSDYSKLSSYLTAASLDIRIACGETIALVYELGRNRTEGFRFPNHQQVVENLDELSNDSSKIKTKRDKRIQRFSFRQVYSCIVDKEPPCVSIKFNRQSLDLQSCSDKLFYDFCCEILHGGIMRHLERNELLRDVFDLGPVLLDSAPDKIDKRSKMSHHLAVDKMRNQMRSKQRDKRTAVY